MRALCVVDSWESQWQLCKNEFARNYYGLYRSFFTANNTHAAISDFEKNFIIKRPVSPSNCI